MLLALLAVCHDLTHIFIETLCTHENLSLLSCDRLCLLGSGTGSREYSSSCPWLAITKRESATLLVCREQPLWTPVEIIIIVSVSSTLNSISSLSMRNFKLLKSCKIVSERNIVRVLRNVKSLITVMDVFTTCSFSHHK